MNDWAICENCDGDGQVCPECGAPEFHCECGSDADLAECPMCAGSGRTDAFNEVRR